MYNIIFRLYDSGCKNITFCSNWNINHRVRTLSTYVWLLKFNNKFLFTIKLCTYCSYETTNLFVYNYDKIDFSSLASTTKSIRVTTTTSPIRIKHVPSIQQFSYPKQGKVLVYSTGLIQCFDQGNFPHPRSCRKFISCAKMETGNVIGWEYTCPKNLSFDPIGGMCNWDFETECED